MRIDSEIRVDAENAWFQRLAEDSRRAPFNQLIAAMNSSLSGQRYEECCAELAMAKWGGWAGVCAFFAACVYFAAGYLEGRSQVAGALCLGALVCGLNWARARERRNAYSSEVALMQEYLLNAGFKLAWQTDTSNSKRPAILTLEWPSA